MVFRFCDERGQSGFSWITDEAMTRTSHALVAGGTAWLVDPLDWPEALDRAFALGKPAAVIQLLDRHSRDAETLAGRLDVPHLVAPASLAGTPFEVVAVMRRRWWQEIALWWPEQRTLVVGDALGSNPFFTVNGDRIGVHGLLKPFPPRALARFVPEHVLVGHGEGVHGADAAEQLERALSRSRLRFVEWGVTLPFRTRTH